MRIARSVGLAMFLVSLLLVPGIPGYAAFAQATPVGKPVQQDQMRLSPLD